MRKNCIVIWYVDYCSILFKDKKTIDTLIKIYQKFKLNYEGGVKSHLGINFSKYSNRTITMRKTAIINKILNRLAIRNEYKKHDTPAIVILTKYEDGNVRKHEWQYWSVIGIKKCLAGTTRPDNIFAVHQCAKYSIDPK